MPSGVIFLPTTCPMASWGPLLPGHSAATQGSFRPRSYPRRSLCTSHRPLTLPGTAPPAQDCGIPAEASSRLF